MSKFKSLDQLQDGDVIFLHGAQVAISEHMSCPSCAQLYFCRGHQYVNRSWAMGEIAKKEGWNAKAIVYPDLT